MIRILATRSGAVYATDGEWISRRTTRRDVAKRGDETPLKLLTPIPDRSLVGERALLHLEPLSDLGPDDFGQIGNAEETVRRTSTVVQDFSLEDHELETLMGALEVVTDERVAWAIPQIVITGTGTGTDI